MAKIGETELKNRIKNGELSPVYMLYGEESYLKEHYALRLKSKTVDPAFEDFNFHRYDSNKTPLSDILNDADMMPVMSSHSFLLVHDYPLNKSKDDIKLLEEYCSDVNESAVIVLWFDNVEVDVKKDSKWKKIEALVDKVGVCVDFEKRNERDLARLAAAKAKKASCTLSSADAQYLVSIVGNDIKTVFNELDKMCCYVNGGEITREVIDLLAVKCLQARVFDLSKFILAGNSDGAYEVLRAMFAQKENPISVLSVISSCYIDMYRAKCAIASGEGEASLAKYFNYANRKWLITNAVRDSKKLSLENLRDAIDVLSLTDEKMKSTSLNPNLLLEETVTKLLMLRNG